MCPENTYYSYYLLELHCLCQQVWRGKNSLSSCLPLLLLCSVLSVLTFRSWPPLPCHTLYTSTLPGPAFLEELCAFAASISSLLLPPQAIPVCLCPVTWLIQLWPRQAPAFLSFCCHLQSVYLDSYLPWPLSSDRTCSPSSRPPRSRPALWLFLFLALCRFLPSISKLQASCSGANWTFPLDILLEFHIQQIPNLPNCTSSKPDLTDTSISSSSKSTKTPDLVL